MYGIKIHDGDASNVIITCLQFRNLNLGDVFLYFDSLQSTLLINDFEIFSISLAKGIKKISFYQNYLFKQGLIQIIGCFNVTFNSFNMSNVNGFEDMIQLNNSNISINYGNLQSLSVQNLSIFKIYNSKFYLENSAIYDFNSVLIESILGFIKIDNCTFDNVNSSSILQNAAAVSLQGDVDFLIKNSHFENLYNFANVGI